MQTLDYSPDMMSTAQRRAKPFLIRLCPQGFMEGIDFSAGSVAFSKNAGSLDKRCNIRARGDAGALPYAGPLATAFETACF